MKKTPLYYHEDYKDYQFGKFHPFNPKRFPKYHDTVNDDDGMRSAMDIREPVKATDEELELVHSADYIEEVKNLEESRGELTLDTPIVKGAPDAARYIAGGSLEAAKKIDEERRAVNLGGLHHAGRESGEGFCIFNDVAVAAQYLGEDGERVCVLDTDAHNGNGTMDIFDESSNVLFISIHQDPNTLYPGRGHVEEIGHEGGKGYTVNIPMPRDANITEYYFAIENVVKPIVGQYKPDVLIRNGGSDPHHSDSITDLALDMRGLEYLGRSARDISDNLNAGHIDLMVSGYGRRTVEGWKAITKGALDLEIETPTDQKIGDPHGDPNNQLVDDIEELRDYLSPYWDL